MVTQQSFYWLYHINNNNITWFYCLTSCHHMKKYLGRALANASIGKWSENCVLIGCALSANQSKAQIGFDKAQTLTQKRTFYIVTPAQWEIQIAHICRFYLTTIHLYVLLLTKIFKNPENPDSGKFLTPNFYKIRF